MLLGDGDDVEATRRFAQAMVDRPGPRVLVWSEQDIHQLLTAGTAAGGAQTGVTVALGEPVPTSEGDQAHTGKYRALWAWLRDQPQEYLPVRFADIEEVTGMPLPPSCRKHPAHWSSYEGSAVARAIRDAGWVATTVNLEQEQLVLERQPR